ncbi:MULTISPECIES: DUF397 domain-containing protein [Streptomyces]|uniref:DUF397 domain-containing protein n=1 Tax=Streptomyces drozdowiczii TaxID=202862 RepID=A0ABY6PVP2_9ACTN|nr:MULTISPECIES: DUF397 domain-containing protein [Streptomyces]MCX0243966.1 DUF397 domain-containing protein [Streptomyces drozdowiczii]OKJ76175.1 hypothetical protein AMK30_08020 [Streptomyces sp. CB02460]UZK56186.1 DUF397 domain-containing protein [Streptomyces drozdowiczii]
MTPHWTRSSYCDSAGPDCVEVALPSGPGAAVRLRDSKTPARPALAFEPGAWSEFVGQVGRATVFSSSS